MDAMPCRLLCIDLQIDAVPDREPDPDALTGARELLTLGRRLGWTVAHTRRRTNQPVIRARSGVSATGLNPLMSEQVFFHEQRSIADSPGLSALLHAWRDETVLVAAFDPVALLSCLLACYEPGPRLVLVEDVTSLQALGEAAPVSAFHGAAWKLAFGATTLDDLLARAKRQGIHLFPTSAGEHTSGMPL
jgi:nicotinamidase-related amidase